MKHIISFNTEHWFIFHRLRSQE